MTEIEGDTQGEIRRIVVKIGSSLLTNPDGSLSLDKLNGHVKALKEARESGLEVVLVSSGAVAAGFGELGYTDRPTTTKGKQASAAVGQGQLVHAYSEAFKEFGITVGQVLLTPRDFSIRDSYNNALDTLSLLLERGIIPIVNENDTVAIKRTAFGNNDNLSALVAALLHADFLVILTDVDGVYDKDPRDNSDAKRISKIPAIDEAFLKGISGDSGGKLGTGGMEAKLEAANTALSLGVAAFIGDGTTEKDNKLIDILDGRGEGTYFGESSSLRVNRKKQWIAFHSTVGGSISIDQGAKNALLNQGRSLLPVGVVSVFGEFQSGVVIEVKGPEGELIGKGITQYGSEQLKAALGKSTQEVRELIGVERDEVIHRDQWYFL